jgi:hypothetical protein
MVSSGIISIHHSLLYVVWHVFACHCPLHVAADVEVRAETVQLSIQGGGAPFTMDCPLYNRKLQVVAINNTLAAKRLSLLGIDGSVPTADEKGYTVQTYEPGSTVIITAEPRAGVCGRGGWRVKGEALCWPGPSDIGIAHNATAGLVVAPTLARQHHPIPCGSRTLQQCQEAHCVSASTFCCTVYNARRPTCLSWNVLMECCAGYDFETTPLVGISCCLFVKMHLCRCQDGYGIQSRSSQVPSVVTLGVTSSCLQMIPSRKKICKKSASSAIGVQPKALSQS